MPERDVTPFFSIIVPVYNGEEYLEECINSVISQSYEDWELLLVNDGSADKSEEICRNYVISDGRIKLFSKQNSGQFDTRLVALHHATGQYITALNCDDYYDRDYLEKIYTEIKRHDADVLEWGFRYVYPGRTVTTCPFEGKNVFDNSEYIKELIVKTDHSLCNKAIKRPLFDLDVLDKAPKGIKMSEDHMMMAAAVCKAEKISTVDDIFYNYRQNELSISSKSDGKLAYDLFVVSDFLVDIYKKCGICSDDLLKAEYETVLKCAGFRMKNAFESRKMDYATYRMIRNTRSYKESKKYERKGICPNDSYLVLKFIRNRLFFIPWIIYGYLYKPGK